MVEIALLWMSLDFTDDQSTLVQVMAWCRQATSHYLSQCWPRSVSPYGVTRLQWVKSIVERPELYSLCCLKFEGPLCILYGYIECMEKMVAPFVIPLGLCTPEKATIIVPQGSAIHWLATHNWISSELRPIWRLGEISGDSSLLGPDWGRLGTPSLGMLRTE